MAEDKHLVDTPLWPGLEPAQPTQPVPGGAAPPEAAKATAEGRRPRKKPAAETVAGDAGTPDQPPPAPAAQAVPLRFEEAVAALEEAVRKLEAGDLPLEEAMRLFQEGVRLSRRCAELLDEAERKIELLLAQEGREGQEGQEPTLKPCDVPLGGQGA